MRRALLLGMGLWISTMHSSAQVKLAVFVGGKRSGEASYSHKSMPDGGKLVQLTMNLRGPDGKTASVRSETRYDAKGIATRMFHESIADKGRSRRLVTVTFDDDAAIAVEEVGGKRQTKRVPVVRTAPLANPSQFWFLRDRPNKGERVRYYRFDVGTLSWELSLAAYAGPKDVAIGSAKYAGHEVQEERNVSIVDDRGLPIRLDIGGVRLERISAA